LTGGIKVIVNTTVAVKAVAQVVQVDSSLMLQPSLRQAVSRRFLDEAIR